MNLKLVKVIIVLPGTVLVYIPGVLIWLVAEWGTTISLPSVTQPRFWGALVLGASGFALAAWTVRLFRTFGEGTPAPWDPTKRLIVLGPYRHVRNPMITSVLLMLGSEALFFFSWHLAVWMLVFFLVTPYIFHLWRSGSSNGDSATTTASTRQTYRAGYRGGVPGIQLGVDRRGTVILRSSKINGLVKSAIAADLSMRLASGQSHHDKDTVLSPVRRCENHRSPSFSRS